MKETSDNAVETAKLLVKTMEDDRVKIKNSFPSHASSMLRVHNVFANNLVAPATILSSQSGLSDPTVRTSIEKLIILNIVAEMTGLPRNKKFVYVNYLRIIKEEIGV